MSWIIELFNSCANAKGAVSHFQFWSVNILVYLPECEQEEDVDLLPIKSKTLLNNKQKLSHLGGLCNDYGIPINVLQLKYLWLIWCKYSSVFT